MQKQETVGPLKLMQSHTYTAYQLNFQYSIPKLTEKEALLYSILKITSWAKEKVVRGGITDQKLPDETAEQYATVSPEKLKSFRCDEGYVVQACSMLEHGIWTLKIKEPDTNANDHIGVVGRFFVTNVGIRYIDKGVFSLGCRITVYEPINAESEIEYAYRPAFVRYFLEDDSIEIDKESLIRNKAITLRTDGDIKRIKGILNDEKDNLPCVIVSYAKMSPNLADIIESVETRQVPLFTQPSIIKMASQPDLKKPQIQKPKDIPLFDQDELAKKLFGYARVFLLYPTMEEKLFAEIGRKISDGDAMFIEPKRFGGKTERFRASKTSPMECKHQFEKLVLHCKTYSKRKDFYFGQTIFLDEAYSKELEIKQREFQNTLKNNRIPADIISAEELESYQIQIEDLESQLYAADQAMKAEYERASNDFQKEIESLKQSLEEEKTKNFNIAQKCQRLESQLLEKNEDYEKSIPLDWSYDQAGEWVEKYYPERLILLPRAKRTLKGSTYKDSEMVYKCLKLLATKGYEHYVTHSLSKEDFTEACLAVDRNLDDAILSQKSADAYPNEYYVEYKGKNTRMNRHLRKGNSREEIECLRVYYFVDERDQRIVIGSLPEHLRTSNT